MSKGNCRNMIEVDGQAVLDYLRGWSKLSKTSFANLGEKLGHSNAYITSSCKNNKFPPLEFERLAEITGLNADAVIKKSDELKSDDKIDFDIEQKLDYIISLLESITQPYKI